MDEINTKWLPHLTPEIVSEIENNYLDAYVVALEGWRRGLTLRWHVKDSEKFSEMKTWFVDEPGQLYSLHSEKRSHYFFRTRGDKVTNEAVELGMDKDKTKRILAEKGIPVPEGRQFTEEATEDEIVNYANELGYPIVIKPKDGSFGRGVIANITTDLECKHALDYVRNELNEKNLIVEKYIDGKDYRLYVVDDQVVGAILRIPPNIMGDGINSIDALIDIKNEERKLNPRLAKTLIKIDKELVDYIGRNGYTLQSIPGKGDMVYLNDKCNISIGGDPIDVLDELSEETKQLAVNALRAIPGLVHGAVDLMVETDDDGNEKGYVIELNPTAQIGGILFPLKGKSRDIPKAIIDYYFPETKDVETDKEKIYFDYYDVLEPLISRQGVISTVSPAPVGKIYMKKYIAYGDVQDYGYHQGLRKQAFERNLHGHIENVGEDAIEIIVAGLDLDMLEDFKHGITEDEVRASVNEIQVSDYDGFVKVGFDSQANFKTLAEEINVLREELLEQNKQIKKLEIERRKYHRSFYWKITAPIRLLGAIRRNFK